MGQLWKIYWLLQKTNVTLFVGIVALKVGQARCHGLMKDWSSRVVTCLEAPDQYLICTRMHWSETTLTIQTIASKSKLGSSASEECLLLSFVRCWRARDIAREHSEPSNKLMLVTDNDWHWYVHIFTVTMANLWWLLRGILLKPSVSSCFCGILPCYSPGSGEKQLVPRWLSSPLCLFPHRQHWNVKEFYSISKNCAIR